MGGDGCRVPHQLTLERGHSGHLGDGSGGQPVLQDTIGMAHHATDWHRAVLRATHRTTPRMKVMFVLSSWMGNG